MAYHILCTTILLLALWSCTVNAQFNASSCGSLLPLEGNVQQGDAPFSVSLPKAPTTYTPGAPPISVYLDSSRIITASSLILQARRAESVNTIPVGSFERSNDYENLQCQTSGAGTVISSIPNRIEFRKFRWKPPAMAVGDVIFIASVVETNGNAWVGVRSHPLPGPADTSPRIGNCSSSFSVTAALGSTTTSVIRVQKSPNHLGVCIGSSAALICISFFIGIAVTLFCVRYRKHKPEHTAADIVLSDQPAPSGQGGITNSSDQSTPGTDHPPRQYEKKIHSTGGQSNPGSDQPPVEYEKQIYPTFGSDYYTIGSVGTSTAAYEAVETDSA